MHCDKTKYTAEFFLTYQPGPGGRGGGRRNQPFVLTEQVSTPQNRGRGKKKANPANKKRNLEKKLRDIQKLERLRAEGEHLEANQLTKIERKSEIEAEIAKLNSEINKMQNY